MLFIRVTTYVNQFLTGEDTQTRQTSQWGRSSPTIGRTEKPRQFRAIATKRVAQLPLSLILPYLPTYVRGIGIIMIRGSE